MMKARGLSTVAAGALTVLVLLTTTAARSTRTPGPVLSVSPSAITFATITAGEFDYQMVTITNSGDAGDYIQTATADPDPPFFPTFGGTCNTSIGPDGVTPYYIPAGGSCTFQWGFHPTHPGKRTGTGTLVFVTSAPIDVSLSGKATH
jgi:hypothetical protein